MKTAIITTIDHNIGDDFVREGVLFLLQQKFGDFSQALIHKHIPLTVRPEWEWYYSSGLSRQLDRLPRAKGLFWSRVIDRFPLNPVTDKILSCDLLVQSGAPVYWERACDNEWFEPLINKRYRSIAHNVPFINIGAGSCLPYCSDGSEILSDPECVAYIRELHSLSTITTFRDVLSRSILNRLGLDAPVLPCPSIFARDNLKVDRQVPEYIALNFMPYGGHYEFGQGISDTEWEKSFADFYRSIRRRYPVVFVCHDAREYSHALRLAPEAPRFIGTSARQYLEFYSKACYFIGCRVHGAFAAASFGRPAFVIGSDSRALMTEQIALSNTFVSGVTASDLMAVADELEKSAGHYIEQFDSIKNDALHGYMKEISKLRIEIDRDHVID